MKAWYHGWQPLTFAQERPIGAEEPAERVAERILFEGPNEGYRGEKERRIALPDDQAVCKHL
jgi:hypothetical protein